MVMFPWVARHNLWHVMTELLMTEWLMTEWLMTEWLGLLKTLFGWYLAGTMS